MDGANTEAKIIDFYLMFKYFALFFFQKRNTDLDDKTSTMSKHLQSEKTGDSPKIPLILKSEDKAANNETNPTWLERTFRILFVLLWLIAFYIAVISSQVSGLKGNIFGLTSARFAFQFLLITSIVIWKRCPLNIQKEHIHILIAASLSDMIYTTCVYSVATFMAVGNFDAIFVSFYCIISVLVDFIRRTVTWRPLICALMASIGILAISQPWHIQDKRQIPEDAPCNYLDDFTGSNGNISNISIIRTSGHQQMHHDSIAIGYILLVIAAAAFVASGNFVKMIAKDYPLPTVMFWQALVEGVACFTICIAWTRSKNESYLTLPGGIYCLLFTFLFIMCSAFSQTASFLAYKYFAISLLALSCISVSLALYIGQRTFLKAFHPGHANVLEFIGIAIVIFATAILPAIFVCIEQNQQHK